MMISIIGLVSCDHSIVQLIIGTRITSVSSFYLLKTGLNKHSLNQLKFTIKNLGWKMLSFYQVLCMILWEN